MSKKNNNDKNFLLKFLEKKQSDVQIKIIFGIVISITLFALFTLINNIKDFKNSVYKESLKKSVIVIDSTGNMEQVRLSETLPQVLTRISIEYLKKMFQYDYLNYKNNLFFIKTFSTKQAYQKWYSLFQNAAKDIEFTKASYKVEIEKFKIVQDSTGFTIYSIIKQKKISIVKNISSEYFVKLHFIMSEPNIVNKLGLYVNELTLKSLKNMDKDELKQIFGK